MYSNKLISEIKELYPNSPTIIKMAEQGDFLLGFLIEVPNKGISYEEILKANDLESLKEKSLLIKRKVDAYKLWLTEDPRHQSNIKI